MKRFAIQTAKKAGKLILDHFNQLGKNDVTYKSSHELVTKFDFESEKLIISEIQKKFPDHTIISEEAGEFPKHSDYTWVIDPLDGSTNFKIGSPFWAVSIALIKNDSVILSSSEGSQEPVLSSTPRSLRLEESKSKDSSASLQNDSTSYKGEIILGVIYAPALRELYVAEKGQGAYLNNKKIRVSDQDNFANAINAYCHGSTLSDIKKAVAIYDYLKLHTRDCRQLGSAALELGFVAAGRIESINIPGAHKWDVSAGVLLVREAAGQVTDFSGKDWDLGSHDILATNGKIHQQLLEIINQ